MVDWANLIYFFTLLAVEKPPSVMKFFVDQIDTIYILEKRDKVGSPQVSPGLSEEVQKRISSYVSQKTQGFNVLDNHYQVSEFKFHRGKGEGPFLNDDHLNATRLRAGVDKLGDGPNFENETPLLKFLRPNFSPHDVGKSCFNEAWTKNAVLRSYSTMCYTSVEEIIAVTKVDVFDFSHRELNLLYQETKTFCVTPLGGGPQNIGTEIMIYEVLPKEKFNNSDGNESKRRYGGLFLRLNDRREEVPPSFSFFEEKDVYDESIFKATKLFPVGFPSVWHLGLQCIFVKHECFRQSTGANVVLPRMKISEFLDIRFFYPMSFHDARRRCDVEGDHEITIDLVRIGLCEIVGTHVPGEEGTTVFNWMIRDKVYHKQVLWSQFHGTIPNDPTTVTMSLPKDIINANLLNVGPTFYLKQLHRRYRMTIELSVKVRMGARKVERCMQVSLPINVAHEEDISH
ncbi:hypothetical protein CXQ85_004830 [Candidozyma haemuli]|uniref:Uncharacterized protein n=1 Tax=Candidozyma haemuli TaxID=45357 RepID=A0A2V1AVM6_9ASCO|nr:hypothetical protein CXQ85_004830 [[Candida] haemuloni]PVH22160.1 hypothetical protein CXQ85_004830 [[Candida] haemuloni]